MTDEQLEVMFLEWWQQSYPTPPGPHARMTHMGWARHLLEQFNEQQQQQEAIR